MRHLENRGLLLPAPAVAPKLDPHFRPALLACRAFRERATAGGGAVPARFALEQADGSVFHFATELCAEGGPGAAGNFTHLERLVKFALWSRGGFRIYLDGPPGLAEKLAAHYRETPTGRFDSEIVGERIYD